MIQEANLHWQYYDTECQLVMGWYVLPCLEWLKEQDTSKWSVFEYGAGYSSIWWRVNCKEVHSVDSHPIWAKAMGVELAEIKEDYLNAIKNTGLYECIVIDGDYRPECVAMSMDCLLPRGFMIIDNWEETDGFDCAGIDKILSGWHKRVFQQPNHSDWRTAVFRKP